VHPEALAWVARHATAEPVTVLDIGGRFINGTPRDLFPAASYTVLDALTGPNVDIVADASMWTPDVEYDMIICTEVFEHAASWRAICATAFKACTPDGTLVVTCAGPSREIHSGVDGSPQLRAGEHYANIEPDDLRTVLAACGWQEIVVDQFGTDVRATARR